MKPRRRSSLDDRDDVARRVLEPGDGRSVGLARDAALVLARSLVPLELDAGLHKLVDGLLDVRDREVEDGECRRLVVRLRVDQDATSAAPQLEVEHAVLFGDLQPKGLAIELLALRDVIRREP